jgi:hypothetical protein
MKIANNAKWYVLAYVHSANTILGRPRFFHQIDFLLSSIFIFLWTIDSYHRTLPNWLV